jgi:hypothetical protein
LKDRKRLVSVAFLRAGLGFWSGAQCQVHVRKHSQQYVKKTFISASGFSVRNPAILLVKLHFRFSDIRSVRFLYPLATKMYKGRIVLIEGAFVALSRHFKKNGTKAPGGGSSTGKGLLSSEINGGEN